MSSRTHRISLQLAGVALAALLALPAGLGSAFAGEQASSDQIIKALKPHRTRSLTATPAENARAAQDMHFVDTLRNRTSRSLTSAEREQITSIVQDKPSIDLEINFEFNSANIASSAAPQVAALGSALNSADLKGRTFVLAGYTDAKGTDGYNQDLSERRADAVKRYLQQKYGIDSANLVTVGYGKTKLKNEANPFAAENRRVQVVNVADK